MKGKTEANLNRLSEFERQVAEGDEDAWHAFDQC